MHLKFAIRDDDVCYHTEPSMLDKLYDDISRQCPISFACIPFVGGFDVDNFTPEKWAELDFQWKQWQTKTIHPLADNVPLTKWLQTRCKEGRASILLHGIHHDLYEFTKKREFTAEIKNAKEYLETLFHRPVTVATPPNNSLMPSAVKALESNGFNVLIDYGFRPLERPLGLDNFYNFAKVIRHHVFLGKTHRRLKPWHFAKHSEQACYSLGPNSDLEAMMQGLERAMKRGGNYVVATHFYQLNEHPELLAFLKKLLETAKNKLGQDVEFVTAEALF